MTSTVRAINFQHPSSTAANMTLASDGTVTGGIPSPNRNLLYNSAMQIAQRGTSTASITSFGYFTADRWQCNLNTLGTWTQSVENDAPTGSGFRKSLKMLCTTADASPAAGDYLMIEQRLEGQDVQRIAKGTSAAQTLTLSFWVKSNVTGTFIAALQDGGSPERTVSASYTISASATWERKVVTFPADTGGSVLANDNTTQLYVRFYLAVGSNYMSSPLQTAWAASFANSATSQTNLAAATNNYWQVTGAQLETGSVATAFEFKSFGQELRECQRYYYRLTQNTGRYGIGYAKTTTTADVIVDFPVTMRTSPAALEQTGTATDYLITYQATAAACSAVPTFTNATVKAGTVNFTIAAGLTAGNGIAGGSNTSASYLGWSAEL